MAATHPIFPCMHCNSHDPRAVSNLGHKLINIGLYFYPLVFVTPPTLKADFTTSVTLLDTLEEQTRENPRNKPLRDAQCLVVFNQIFSLLNYVKPICGQDIDLITKSGFDTNVQAQKAPIPDQPVVLRIEKGKETGTFKVFLQRRINKPDVAQDPSTHQQNNTYGVDITLTPDVEASWGNVVAGVKSNSIIFNTYTPLVKNYGRVWARNPSGRGQASMTFSFIPE